MSLRGYLRTLLTLSLESLTLKAASGNDFINRRRFLSRARGQRMLSFPLPPWGTGSRVFSLQMKTKGTNAARQRNIWGSRWDMFLTNFTTPRLFQRLLLLRIFVCTCGPVL